MVTIYNFYTSQCQQEYAKNPGCYTFYSFKKMRAVRRDILKMFTVFVQFTGDKNASAQKYLPQMFNILKTYREELEVLREPELILLFSKVIEVFGPVVAEYVPNILDCIFGATLNMISADFKSYPDHRVNFFIFLKTVVENCFQALLNVPPEQLDIIINCMIWSMKHELSLIYMVGLDSLLALINVASAYRQKINTNINLANNFYKKYYMRIFNDTFYVLIDKLHGDGFKQQMQILRTLIQILDYVGLVEPAERASRRYRIRQQAVRAPDHLPADGRRLHQPVQGRPPALPAKPL